MQTSKRKRMGDWISFAPHPFKELKAIRLCDCLCLGRRYNSFIVRRIVVALFCLGLAGLGLVPRHADAKSMTRAPAAVEIGWIDYVNDRDSGKRYATIHFDTEANRTYNVQSAPTPRTPDASWTTVYTARALPFANHYVVADEMTNTARFYRLFVVP